MFQVCAFHIISPISKLETSLVQYILNSSQYLKLSTFSVEREGRFYKPGARLLAYAITYFSPWTSH